MKFIQLTYSFNNLSGGIVKLSRFISEKQSNKITMIEEHPNNTSTIYFKGNKWYTFDGTPEEIIEKINSITSPPLTALESFTYKKLERAAEYGISPEEHNAASNPACVHGVPFSEECKMCCHEINETPEETTQN